ncbi:MAG TPA: COX15/CtaA family protein [Naasia sp.]|jgi:cytochrome c oxidase assembly protein subunit 15
MRTPLSWLADRVELGPRALRWGTTAALIASILIIVTGGVVRVTGSGLGCPTWPECSAGSIATTPELGIHGLIEFTNRALTGVLVVAVGWAILAARLQRPRQRVLTRLAWSQFWLVLVNAIAGGISVLAELNPWVVALHFLLAIALLATTTLTWHRARQSTGAVVLPAADARLADVLTVTTFALLVVGTLVTGSGPHSGDSAEVPRMGFNWTVVTYVHSALAVLVLCLAVVLLLRLRRPEARVARRRVITLLAVFALQGLVGVVQALNGLPEVLVVLHLLGSALVWVGAVRVLLDVRPRLFGAVLPPAGDAPGEPAFAASRNPVGAPPRP